MPRGAEPGRRPDRLVLVAGTGTGVGKTWVAARLLERLGAGGAAVAARKPAQSFDPGDDPSATDAAVLGAASGEPAATVCPPEHWYPVAMAPPMAAAALGRPPLRLADLLGALAWPARWPPGHPTVGVVETAGGVRSPQADDGDAVDLARLLAPDLVVVVADPGLGAINAVRLSVDALGAGSRPDVVVVLNRFDPGHDLHRRNHRWLAEVDAMDVLVTPGDEPALTERAAAAPRGPAG